jgi:hypothetical protein
MGLRLPPPAPNAAPAVEHIRYAVRRVASSAEAMPYALQVVIQTDSPIDSPIFKIHCDAQIQDGRFFVAGQAAMMNVRSGVVDESRAFLLGFGFPVFKPESPIVVTLLSKNDFTVTSIERLM